MPVKHALLALLAQRDLTGYELKVRFERAVGDFWQLNSGQVYSTLERLRRAGLVTRQKERGTVERSRYAILTRGRRQLAHWLAAPAPRLRPIRDPLYVKLVFTPPDDIPALLRSLVAETRRYGDAVETLGALVAREPLSISGRARWLVAEAARLQYVAQLSWLAAVRRMLLRDGGGANGVTATADSAGRRTPFRALAPLREAAPRSLVTSDEARADGVPG